MRSGIRIRPILSCAFALSLAGTGAVATFAPAATVSAANVSLQQCNGVRNAGGLTVQCHVTIVNNLTGNPSTTGSIVTINGGAPTTSPNIVTSVNECNGRRTAVAAPCCAP
jgi:hypothetical protein